MSSSVDESDETTEPPAAQDNASCCEENNILSQLEKRYYTTDQEGPEIKASLATIMNSLLKEKADDEKLTDIRKRYDKSKHEQRRAYRNKDKY